MASERASVSGVQAAAEERDGDGLEELLGQKIIDDTVGGLEREHDGLQPLLVRGARKRG